MSGFAEVLGFSLSVTGPIFVILTLGVVLRRRGMLSDGFIDSGSRLVFTIALPALIFSSIAKTRISDSANLSLIGFGVIMTLVVYLALEWIAARRIEPPEDRGVVVQGAFRSNMGIIGLAYTVNAYGDAGLVAASLYVGLITILFNVLSVITLSRSLSRSRGVRSIVRGIATNPLIIGIVLALPVSWLELALPSVVRQSVEYFADMTLPVALICTGASLNFRSLRTELRSTVFATASKLLAVPVLFTVIGIAVGFRGIDLGVLLLMSSAPTAAASYAMVRAMGGNSALAANIVVLTTLGSIFTTTFAITLLRALQLI